MGVSVEALKNEIKEYKIDGLIDIKAYLIDSTIVIGVDAYDLEAGLEYKPGRR